MLIRYNIENLLSFNQKVEFNLIAGNSRQLKNHVILGKSRHDPKILKSSIIYGPNASGKSNFVKSIEFIKNFIINGPFTDELIPRKHFKLNEENSMKPSSFEIEIKLGESIFAYGSKFTSKQVDEEWLIQIGKTSEKELFRRKTENGNVSVLFGINFKTVKEKQFYEFTANGTRPNKLFLTETVDRNISKFRKIYDWFKNDLIIIYPTSKLEDIEFILQSDKNLCEHYKNFFNLFDIGIDGIQAKEFDVENDLNFPQKLIDDLNKIIKDNKTSAVVRKIFDERYRVFKNDNNVLKASKIQILHKLLNSNTSISFDLHEESDGTKRLIDIFPVLIELTSSSKVFIIDEINRSLHSHLTNKLFEVFFSKSFYSSQLIATTHELNLLDLDLFRKDEIWFIEKDKEKSSQMYSLEEFKPRYDRDIRKGYLLGRFGAIPIVNKISDLGWL